MAAAVSFRVINAGTRRLVTTSPSHRPDLRLAPAHPKRPAQPGRVVQVASCAVARPVVRSRWVVLKVAVVSVLAVLGSAVSVSQLVANATPDPAREYVAGDPAWAHVDQP